MRKALSQYTWGNNECNLLGIQNTENNLKTNTQQSVERAILRITVQRYKEFNLDQRTH